MSHPHTRPYGPKRHREGQPDLRGLDEIHRRVVMAACAGQIAEFEDTDVLDAEVLAALITGRSYKGRQPWPVAPKGVQIKGGLVETRLDLSQSRIDWPLELIGTDLPGGVDLEEAQSRGLLFDHCKLRNLHLPGSYVNGQLCTNHATFNTPHGDAIWAQGADITGGIFMNNAIINGPCDIVSAKISGQFSGTSSVFNTPNGVALRAQNSEISGGMFLHGATLNGQCDINDATIRYQFGANEAKFNNLNGIALWAQGAKILGGMFLTAAGLNGQCDINRSKIGGPFVASEAKFNTPDDIALRAQSAEISEGVFLNNATLNGQYAINRAKVGGPVIADHATFNTPNGTALWAQGAELSGGVYLIKTTITGECDFNGAQTGEIFLNGTHLIGLFRGDFEARIKRLDLRGARLVSLFHAQYENTLPDNTVSKYNSRNSSDACALDLTDARIGRLDMPHRPQDRIKGIVKLTRCHVERFCDHKRAWTEGLVRKEGHWVTPPSRRDPATGNDIGYYDLNGFTYDYLAAPNGGAADGAEESTAQARKRWLLSQHADDIADQFKPQPWRQMAARLEAQGHDDAARKIALFRRQIHRQSKAVTGWRVVISWLLDKLSHYGFNPWLTMAWSGGVIAFCAFVYGCSAATGPMPDGGYSPMAGYTAAGPASDANANPPPVFIRAQADDVTAATNISDLAQADPFLSRVYPDFNPLLYSLDVFVPVLDLGMEAYWRPNPNYVTQDTYDLALNFWIMVDRQLPIIRWILPQRVHPLSQNWVWLNGSMLYWLTIVQRFVGAILIAIMVTSFTGLLTREDKLS